MAAELWHQCRKRLPSAFNAGSRCIIVWLANVPPRRTSIWGGVCKYGNLIELQQLDRKAFEDLFEQEVAIPLRANGFTPSGKSLFYQDSSRQIGLIRGGGRLSRPSAIVHVIAFRPSFAREITNLTIPDTAPKDVDDYPFVFNPELLSNTGPDDWAFSPDLHWRKPYGLYSYGEMDNAVVCDHLGSIRKAILTRWIPWTATMDAKSIKAQLQPHLEKWWIARIWTEDCEADLRKQL